MDQNLAALAAAVKENSDQIASMIAKLSEEPNVIRQDAAVGVAGRPTDQSPSVRRALTFAEKSELKAQLHSLTDAQLTAAFFAQLQVRDTGIPLYKWLDAGGYAAQQAFAGINEQVTPDVMKAIDTGGAAALIRQDLEPFLYELYVRKFPLYERITKEPANGLTHAWNQITSFGDAQFMAELGTVTDDLSTYVRKTTNVAILATRRGVSLKSQFAVLAGGMNYNPEQLELQGGLRAMAYRMQTAIFSMQATVTGHTDYTDEYGKYDANGFDGLRMQLGIGSYASTFNVDPATSPTTTGNVRRAVDSAIQPIIDNGGDAGALEIWSSSREKVTFDEQQDANVRFMEANQRGANIGVVTNAVNTIAGPIPWNFVPGNGIDPTTGWAGYTPAAGGYTKARDIYLLDPAALSMPYLGTEGPTVLDIPIGISGQLTRLFVIFQMAGLAPKSLLWLGKVRVKVS